MTQHAHGTDAAGIVELDLNPADAPPGVTPPPGCWLGTDNGIVSTDGNVIMHQTVNKTGGWFTTTYAGDANVYPLLLVNGQPVVDPITGDNEVDTSGGPIATGHLTTWFGDENNSVDPVTGVPKVDVEHATVSFHGTLTNGTAVNLNGHFQFALHSGTPQVMNANISC
jgi:hypothetical protein